MIYIYIYIYIHTKKNQKNIFISYVIFMYFLSFLHQNFIADKQIN